MNGRVYDYNVGRFLSVDPFVHGGSQGINPYSYLLNNPMAGTDPTGYKPCDEGEVCPNEPEEKVEETKEPIIIKGDRRSATLSGRRDRKVGTLHSRTVTNSDGEVTNRSTVATYNNGDYSGNNISYGDNGAVKKVNIFKGDNAGSSSTATVDINSLGEIASISTLETTLSNNGQRTNKRNAGPMLVLGYTGATGYSVHGEHHAYVLALDPKTNSGFVVRAGPSIGPTKGFGNIRAIFGNFSNKDRPKDSPQKTLAYQMLGTSNYSFETIQLAMMDHAIRTNYRQIPYSLLGPNCYSFAFSFAKKMGYKKERPHIDSLGWDTKL